MPKKWINTHICPHAYMHTYMHGTHTYIRAHILTNTHIHTYKSHTYAHAHMCMHTQPGPDVQKYFFLALQKQAFMGGKVDRQKGQIINLAAGREQEEGRTRPWGPDMKREEGPPPPLLCPYSGQDNWTPEFLTFLWASG